MAKTKIVKTRKYRWRVWVMTFFTIMVTAQIISAIGLRTYQTSLSVKIQQTERAIAVLQTENEALQVDIGRLSNYNRIVAMANEQGYSSVNQNVISVYNKND